MKKCAFCGKEANDELCEDCTFLGETHYMFLCGFCGNQGAIERTEKSMLAVMQMYDVSREEIGEVVLICTTGCNKCNARGSA